MNITKERMDIEAAYLFGNLTLEQYMQEIDALNNDSLFDVNYDVYEAVEDIPVAKHGTYHVYHFDRVHGFIDTVYGNEDDAMEAWYDYADRNVFTVFYDERTKHHYIANDIRYQDDTRYLKTDVKIKNWITEGNYMGVKFTCDENAFDNSITFHDETFGTWIRCNAA